MMFAIGVVVGMMVSEVVRHPEWITDLIAWIKSLRKAGDPPKS